MSGAMPIYLDHHATTPVDPRVLDAMLPWLGARYGNAQSADHEWGWQAEEAVEAARRQVAALAGAAPTEVIFTAGATEANNLALLGSAAALAERGRRHIIASPLEHSSVAEPLAALARAGAELTILPIRADGVLDPDAVVAALRPETGLVTVIAASHEIGTLQPLQAIAALCRAGGILMHSDAAQAAGPVGLGPEDGDLISLSAHKLYGPQGIGALIRRGPAPGLVRPILQGGGQERGLRPGTIPVALAAGFGAAAALACADRAAEADRLRALRQRLLDGLDRAGLDYAVNGALSPRLPGNLSLRCPGIDAETLIAALRLRLAVSAGAACASARRAPSPALLALGLDEAAALETIRIGLGRGTGPAEIDAAVAALLAAVRQIAARR
jgi:cysteine desulfurase